MRRIVVRLLLTRATRLSCVLVLLAAAPSPLHGQSLRGSSSSLDVQNRVAREHDFTFLRTSRQVDRFVDAGYLVRVRPNRDFDLHAVSFPFARPEVELFIRRLAAQYRAACGEKLVVTSLTRPLDRQPRNASVRSVHPTGMAIDIRRSNRTSCRRWLEDVLIDLERGRLLEATRERFPAHYHVAVFPRPYASYVRRRAARADAPEPGSASRAYQVRAGDSLWEIARRAGTTVDRLKASNGLTSNRIFPGQVIRLPAEE